MPVKCRYRWAAKQSETRSHAVARIADRTASKYLCGHVTSSVTWPYSICHFLLVVPWNGVSISSHFRDKHIVVKSLTFQGQGHVKSSVMWPFDSQYAISYWWSFGTKPLSLTVSKISNIECNVGVTLIWPLNKGQRLKAIHFGTNQFLIYDLHIGCQ